VKTIDWKEYRFVLILRKTLKMASGLQNQGNSFKYMIRLRRIFETTPEISIISPQQEFSLYWNEQFSGIGIG